MLKRFVFLGSRWLEWVRLNLNGVQARLQQPMALSECIGALLARIHLGCQVHQVRRHLLHSFRLLAV